MRFFTHGKILEFEQYNRLIWNTNIQTGVGHQILKYCFLYTVHDLCSQHLLNFCTEQTLC